MASHWKNRKEQSYAITQFLAASVGCIGMMFLVLVVVGILLLFLHSPESVHG